MRKETVNIYKYEELNENGKRNVHLWGKLMFGTSYWKNNKESVLSKKEFFFNGDPFMKEP